MVARIPFELKGKSVFVAGHRGMVGAALVRRLAREDVELLTASRSEFDLRDQAGLSIEEHVVTDPSLVRPAEVEQLIGDATKAREQLGWRPTTDFETMIRLMVDSDLALLSS